MSVKKLKLVKLIQKSLSYELIQFNQQRKSRNVVLSIFYFRFRSNWSYSLFANFSYFS